MTLVQRHAELVYAESLLLKAVMGSEYYSFSIQSCTEFRLLTPTFLSLFFFTLFSSLLWRFLRFRFRSSQHA